MFIHDNNIKYQHDRERDCLLRMECSFGRNKIPEKNVPRNSSQIEIGEKA